MSYQLKSRATAAGDQLESGFSPGNSRDFAVKAGHRRHRLARSSVWYAASLRLPRTHLSRVRLTTTGPELW